MSTTNTTLEEGLGRSGTELIVREICSLRSKIDNATNVASDNPFTKGGGSPSAVLRDSGSTASGNYSVAEGNQTIASGTASHAEGQGMPIFNAFGPVSVIRDTQFGLSTITV